MTIVVAVIVAIVVLVGALFGRHGLPELKRYMKIRRM
jgi:hypothetical protein